MRFYCLVYFYRSALEWAENLHNLIIIGCLAWLRRNSGLECLINWPLMRPKQTIRRWAHLYKEQRLAYYVIISLASTSCLLLNCGFVSRCGNFSFPRLELIDESPWLIDWIISYVDMTRKSNSKHVVCVHHWTPVMCAVRREKTVLSCWRKGANFASESADNSVSTAEKWISLHPKTFKCPFYGPFTTSLVIKPTAKYAMI